MKGGRLLVVFGLLTVCCGQAPKKVARATAETRADTLKLQAATAHKAVAQPGSVYFKAAGTEPFWGLEIGPSFIRLMTPGDTISTPHAEPRRAADANVKRYDLTTEASLLQIEIAMEECANAMSDEKFPYSVWIAYRRTAEPELKVVEGCGRYVPDYRLHDIWVLESVRGTAVSASDYLEGLPSLEIRAAEQTYSGATGCNRMMGTFFWEPGTIRFGPTALTRKACPDMADQEQDFLAALAASTAYSIAENRLRLNNPDGELLVLKKVD